jgi:NtrC-family two-component system sensor histidine kinase KinB
LKEVERLKSDFVMAASHELRTPLTSIGMGIDLLLEHAAEGLSPRDRELLQAAHEEVHRLKALVNDLLDLSKIEAGRIQLEFEHLSLRDVMDRVAVVLRAQIEEKAVKFEVDIPADLSRVRADLNKITWVLINLVSNAMRFVTKGGHIRVWGQPVGAYVHLSVCDDGPGIPTEYQSKIFQKFVQVKGVESGGTGLGLAICKEIVRAHSGSIWVESSPGKGSTFTFALPTEA